MQFTEYIKNLGHNILSLSKLCGIPYATLYTSIENPSSMKADNLSKLSAQLCISMDEAFLMLNEGKQTNRLLSLILKQQSTKEGLYADTAVSFAYHTGVLENLGLGINDVKNIFEAGRIDGFYEVKDIVFTACFFKAFDEMLKSADSFLSIQMIEKYSLMMYSRPLETEEKTKLHTLLLRYNSLGKVTFPEIIKFHVDFSAVTNMGAAARLLSFKECLRADIVPFIIDSDYKAFYERGIQRFYSDSTFLSDICLKMQESFYERIKEFQNQEA